MAAAGHWQGQHRRAVLGAGLAQQVEVHAVITVSKTGHLLRADGGKVHAGLGLHFVLLLAAGGLYAYNRYEDAHAGAEAQTVVADLQQKVETPEPEAESGPLDPELPVVEIDGNEYVGEISIPAIGIDLPVMSEWSYPRLKIAPCRQFGSSRTDDLVIAAHNYESHFGKLTSLTAGDSVTFTDMDGIVNEYVVNKVEVP